MEQTYSLFLLEEKIYPDNGIGMTTSYFSKKSFQYVETFHTLEEAKLAQKDYELKTIILPSYGI